MKTTTVSIGHGRTAISFVPEDSKELAIVHLSTIKRLARMLPSVSPDVILNELIADLSGLKDRRAMVAEAITICNEFTAFHESVNLIERYVPGTGTDEPENTVNTAVHDDSSL